MFFLCVAECLPLISYCLRTSHLMSHGVTHHQWFRVRAVYSVIARAPLIIAFT